MRKVHEIALRSAERWPRDTAIVDAFDRVYYRDLYQRIKETRMRLLQVGVGPGIGVGVVARDGSAFLISAFAVLECGGVVMPLSAKLDAKTMRSLLNAIPPHALIEDGSAPQILNDFASLIEIPDTPSLRFTWTGVSRHRPFTGHVPDPAFLRFSSGSAGRSKGVVLSHPDAIERAEAIGSALAIGNTDTVLCALPMSAYFSVTILPFLAQGAQTIVCADKSARDIQELASKNQATLLFLSPRQVKRLVMEPSEESLPGVMRRVVCLGGGLAESVARQFQDRYGKPVVQAYESIEAGMPLVNTDKPAGLPGSVGRPVEGFSMIIIGPDGKPAREGEIGELAIQGPGLFTAYRHPHRMRQELLRGDWFFTGDLARRDAENFFFIVGRVSSLIEFNGQRLSPEFFEREIDALAGVRVSRLRVARKAGGTEQALRLEIVPSNPRTPPLIEDILAFCRQRFGPQLVPDAVAFVEDFPVSLNGSVLRAR
jgi:acyl-CoA synthetase (AMP-forming)/AMP-acid ligase II